MLMLITILYLLELDRGKWNDTKNAKMAILCCHNYKPYLYQLSIVNLNHFYFDGVRLTEPAQFTVYPKKGFYDWHMDLNAFGQTGDNPIRKISMTCLLSDPSEFTGGDLLFSDAGNEKPLQLKQGQAIFFASFLRHKVAPVKKGVRKSLVMWFGGPPFK
jgi:PKHD-type hydroxylase